MERRLILVVALAAAALGCSRRSPTAPGTPPASPPPASPVPVGPPSATIAVPTVDHPPMILDLRSEGTSHSSRVTSFVLWDEREPIQWAATLSAPPGVYAGCFDVPGTGRCLPDAISGSSSAGPVRLSQRDGIAGSNPANNYVKLTVRAVDLGGQETLASLRFRVF